MVDDTTYIHNMSTCAQKKCSNSDIYEHLNGKPRGFVFVNCDKITKNKI